MLDLTKGPPRVLVASPSSGTTSDQYNTSLFLMYTNTNPADIELSIPPRTCSGSNIAENQNTLVEQARLWKADYILFIETDVAFPADTARRLLSFRKDVIGVSTQYKEHDLLQQNIAGSPRLPRYMGYELNDDEITLNSLTQGDEIREVKSIPMGLTLLSMRAVNMVADFAKSIDAKYQEALGMAPLPADVWGPAFCHRNAYTPGKHRASVSTTDMTFCHSARAIGLEVWLDARLSLAVQHMGTSAFGVVPPIKAEAK